MTDTPHPAPSVEGPEAKALNPASALSDAELADHANLIIRQMCNGDHWRMSVPVNRHDSDMVLSEVVRRFCALTESLRRYVEARQAWMALPTAEARTRLEAAYAELRALVQP